MSKLETLKAIKALIEDPAHWTQGTFARDVGGKAVGSVSRKAVCWCLVGAYSRVMGGLLIVYEDGGVWDAIDDVSGKLFHDDPAGVNDNRGHAAVMKILDAAIAMAEAQT